MRASSSSSSSSSWTSSLNCDRFTHPCSSPRSISAVSRSMRSSVEELPDPLESLTSEQAAVSSRVWPWPKTTCFESPLRDPHLLERRPVLGGAFCTQQSGAVGLLELAVHLQPAVVGCIGVGPAGLVAVNAEPLVLVRRVQRLPLRTQCAAEPEPHHPLPVRNAAYLVCAGGVAGSRLLHHLLPAPGLVAVLADPVEQERKLCSDGCLLVLRRLLARAGVRNEHHCERGKQGKHRCGFHLGVSPSSPATAVRSATWGAAPREPPRPPSRLAFCESGHRSNGPRRR